MAIGDIIVGIDIGASKLSLIVGEVNNFNQIEVICSTTTKSNGIVKGKVINENQLSECLQKIIADAENEMDMKINSAYVTIPGIYADVFQNSVTKDVKDKYSGISERDVTSLLLAAKMLELPHGKCVIDLVINSFTLDDGKVVEDPVGNFSSFVKLDADIVIADEEYLKILKNVFKKVDIEIDGYIPAALAQKNLILEEHEQKDNVMIIDIGAQHTDIGIFAGECFVYTNSLPIGGDSITSDISIVLNISKEEAEKLKKQYPVALKSYIDNDTEVVLSTVTDNANRIVKTSEIVEIIEARIEQIFDLINKDITNQGYKSKINKVILTGQGIINIDKSDIIGKVILNIPVKMSTGKISGLIKPAYSTAYSLVRYIASRPFSKNISSSVEKESNENLLKKVLYKIKEFFYS